MSSADRVSAGPQDRFNDLYSAVYRVLDDAKEHRDLVKLYKGSHGSRDPHSLVTGLGTYFFVHHRSVFGYVCSQVGHPPPYRVGELDDFDRSYEPRIRTRAAFDLLRAEIGREGESAEDVLNYVADRQHALGAYRGGSSGFDEEARALAAAHFQHEGIEVNPADVSVFCGGFKGVLIALCAALMCRRVYDELHHDGGVVLAPEGYYQSLRLVPTIFGGTITTTHELTGDTVASWLAETDGRAGRIVYVPFVNNATGTVLTDQRAVEIAAVLLDYNRVHPRAPVYVLADEVYVGSCLDPTLTPRSIASITGSEVGSSALGRMADWTVTVVTPSKTFALATSRVAFAATSNQALRHALSHYRTVFSHGRTPQIDEVTGIAAICLTPQRWIDRWNTHYRDTLHWMRSELADINAEVGFDAFTLELPQGGWYAPLRMSRRLVPGVTNAVDALAVLLHYGRDQADTGIGVLPGELFGLAPGATDFALRATFAGDHTELRRSLDRFRQVARALTGPDGARLITEACARARKVADLDAILRHIRY